MKMHILFNIKNFIVIIVIVQIDQEKLSGKRKPSIKLAFSESALNQKKFISSSKIKIT